MRGGEGDVYTDLGMLIGGPKKGTLPAGDTGTGVVTCCRGGVRNQLVSFRNGFGGEIGGLDNSKDLS